MAKKKKGGIMPFLLGIAAALILGWWIFPHILFSTQEQPVTYGHSIHAEQDLECTYCHKFRTDGSFDGVPGIDSCSSPDCHAELMAGTPAEKVLVNEYVKPDKEIPWKTYQKQPDNVYFTHIAHREYDCVRCHPDVEHTDDLPPLYVNKLTGYTRQTMTMDECERCHAQNDASNACYVCHM